MDKLSWCQLGTIKHTPTILNLQTHTHSKNNHDTQHCLYRIWGSYSGGYEEYYLLEYNTLLATCFHASSLLGLFFNTQGGCNMFLRNVGWLSTDYMALYPRRQYSSHTVYVVVSKSSWISSVACQQMAAQGCPRSYSDLQSWKGSVPRDIAVLTSGVVILVFFWSRVCGSLRLHHGQKGGTTSQSEILR
jgi:hypothetical protein